MPASSTWKAELMQSKHPAATLGVLVALCVFALFFGVRALTAPLPDGSIIAEDAPVCEPRDVSPGDTVGPQEVTVSVYNASNRSGMASRVMQGLMERGFSKGSSGNIDAPQVKFVQVWADKKRNPAARLVARQFGANTVVIRKDASEMPGLGIVVVIGPNLKGLVDDAPTSWKSKVNASFCSPPVT